MASFTGIPSSPSAPQLLALSNSKLRASVRRGGGTLGLGRCRYAADLLAPVAAASAPSLRRLKARGAVYASGSGDGSAWEQWQRPPPEKAGGISSLSSSSISDVLWPSAGAFVAMALLGRLDQILASKGISFTIAPLGAVCAVLFATPSSPAAKKYNMFVAQIVCAAFGVFALAIFGPGWLARSTALAASVAFMIITGATHPPAASLPILFIDGAKFHQLQFWYLLFPGATGCFLLCIIQEMVSYLKSNYRF